MFSACGYPLHLPQDSCAGDTLGAGNEPVSKPLMIRVWVCIYTRGEREQKNLHKRRNPFLVTSCQRSLWIYCGVKPNASSSLSINKYFQCRVNWSCLQADKLVLCRPQLYCKPWCGEWLAQQHSWRNFSGLALQASGLVLFCLESDSVIITWLVF